LAVGTPDCPQGSPQSAIRNPQYQFETPFMPFSPCLCDGFDIFSVRGGEEGEALAPPSDFYADTSGNGFRTSDRRHDTARPTISLPQSATDIEAREPAIRNPQSAIAIGTPRSTTNAGGRESAIRNPQSAIAAGAPFLPPLRNIPGSRVVSLDFSKGGKTLNVLTPEFASACSPVVSFDGKRVVFVGKKGADDPWNVWEMSISGDEKRRILETPWDCVTPTYLPSIYTLDNLNPRDQVVFAGAASGEVNEYGTGPAWSFYTCELSGKNLRRITFNLSADFDPAVLPDGRIVFSSWQRFGTRYYPTGLFSLLTVMTDGTDLFPFYGNHELPIIKCKPSPGLGEGGWVYFVESRPGEDPLGGGSIAAVNLRRNFKTYTPIASDRRGIFYSPFPLHGGNLLVSYRKRRPGATYGLYELSPQSGRIVKKLFDEPRWHDVEAHTALPRPRPKGRSSVVNYEVQTADIFCLDCYLSDWPGMEKVAAGSLRRLRIIEGIPLRDDTPIAHRGLRIAKSGIPSGKSEIRNPKSEVQNRRSAVGGPQSEVRNPKSEIRNAKRGEGSALSGTAAKKYSATPFGPRRILGDIPLPSDGSFYIKVPSETPIAFQVLDKNDMAVLTHQNWMWGMPKENRGCIGCHEDRERTPPNRLAEALKKPAPNLNVPPEKRRTVDFQHDIAPLIKTRCLQCHTREHPRLDLTDIAKAGVSRDYHGRFPRAYEVLLSPRDRGAKELAGRYIKPGSARESPLIWRLFGFSISDCGLRTSDSALRAPQSALPNPQPLPGLAIRIPQPPSGLAIRIPQPASGLANPHSAIRNPQSAMDAGAAELMPPKMPLSDSERKLFVEWIDLGAQWSNRPSPEDVASDFRLRISDFRLPTSDLAVRPPQWALPNPQPLPGLAIRIPQPPSGLANPHSAFRNPQFTTDAEVGESAIRNPHSAIKEPVSARAAEKEK